jgi:ribosomal protein S8E
VTQATQVYSHNHRLKSRCSYSSQHSQVSRPASDSVGQVSIHSHRSQSRYDAVIQVNIHSTAAVIQVNMHSHRSQSVQSFKSTFTVITSSQRCSHSSQHSQYRSQSVQLFKSTFTVIARSAVIQVNIRSYHPVSDAVIQVSIHSHRSQSMQSFKSTFTVIE